MEIWNAIFLFQRKMFCYLWIHKKYRQPYIGIVEGQRLNDADLIAEKRSRMKILLIDPDGDLPVNKIEAIIKKAADLYKTGPLKSLSVP